MAACVGYLYPTVLYVLWAVFRDRVSANVLSALSAGSLLNSVEHSSFQAVGMGLSKMRGAGQPMHRIQTREMGHS